MLTLPSDPGPIGIIPLLVPPYSMLAFFYGVNYTYYVMYDITLFKCMHR